MTGAQRAWPSPRPSPVFGGGVGLRATRVALSPALLRLRGRGWGPLCPAGISPRGGERGRDSCLCRNDGRATRVALSPALPRLRGRGQDGFPPSGEGVGGEIPACAGMTGALRAWPSPQPSPVFGGGGWGRPSGAALSALRASPPRGEKGGEVPACAGMTDALRAWPSPRPSPVFGGGGGALSALRASPQRGRKGGRPRAWPSPRPSPTGGGGGITTGRTWA